MTPTNYALNSLFKQQLFFPEVSGLRHILIELRSYTPSITEVIQQIILLQELKRLVQELNPHANVDVELHLLGEKLYHHFYPSSSDAGFRIVRFGQPLEGRGVREFIEWFKNDNSDHSKMFHLMSPVSEWSEPLVAEQRKNYS
jgi:hypothetical protein